MAGSATRARSSDAAASPSSVRRSRKARGAIVWSVPTSTIVGVGAGAVCVRVPLPAWQMGALLSGYRPDLTGANGPLARTSAGRCQLRCGCCVGQAPANKLYQPAGVDQLAYEWWQLLCREHL